ncbi:MAG: hypothetical protein IKD47_02555 [Clostridia bacterium]|nr:hypothetical protein [Clostridia bacterium]
MCNLYTTSATNGCGYNYGNGCGSWFWNSGYQRVCRDACGNIRCNQSCTNCCHYCPCNQCCGCGNNGNMGNNGNTGTTDDTTGNTGNGGFTCVTFCGNTNAAAVARSATTANYADGYYARSYGCGRNRRSCGCWNNA